MSQKKSAAQPVRREETMQKIQQIRRSNAAGQHYKRSKDRANVERKAVCTEMDSH